MTPDLTSAALDLFSVIGYDIIIADPWITPDGWRLPGPHGRHIEYIAGYQLPTSTGYIGPAYTKHKDDHDETNYNLSQWLGLPAGETLLSDHYLGLGGEFDPDHDQTAPVPPDPNTSEAPVPPKQVRSTQTNTALLEANKRKHTEQGTPNSPPHPPHPTARQGNRKKKRKEQKQERRQQSR